MEDKQKLKSANRYNVMKIIVYIICIGIPLRYIYDGFGYGNTIPICVLVCIIAFIIILCSEFFIFKPWKKKLDMIPSITQGNMYTRTFEGYKSANDIQDKNKNIK